MLNIKKITPTIAFLIAVISLSAQNNNDTTFTEQISSSFTEQLNGVVYDASTGIPIEGLNISFSNATSALTDSTGKFSISIPNKNVVVVVSGMDYQAQTLPVKGRDSFEVFMHEQRYPSHNKTIENFYSPKSKTFSEMSASVIADNSDNWKSQGLSPEEIIGNNISGLNVVSRSGTPGMGANMFLRGYSTLYGSTQPLIVVDGFPINTVQTDYSPISGFVSNPLSFIDNNDIENITVVKDASTVYGAQSGNGVVHITTKRTDEMITRINFSAITGINFAPKSIPMMEADDYRRYLSEILQTSGLSGDSINSLPYMNDDPGNPNYYRVHNNTNWSNQIFNDSYLQKYNLRISGGDDIALYSLSVGYTNNQGVLKNTGFDRYSARFNSDINVSPKFTINSGVSFGLNNYLLKEEGMLKTSPVHQSLYKAPFYYTHMKDENNISSPLLETYDDLGISNPMVISDNLEAKSTNYQIFGLFNANYELTKDITISDQIGIDFNKVRNNLFVPHEGIAPDTLSQGISENKMTHQVSRFFSLTNDFRIAYSKTFKYLHHVNAIAGLRMNTMQAEDDWGLAHNSPNDAMKTINNGSNIFRSIGGDFNDINRLTYYVNGDYNFAHKYFVSLYLSLDGASNYGSEADGISLHGNKFGVFPSISAAWVVSSEDFMSDINLIDLLKVRASYGLTGNSDMFDFPSFKYYVSQNFLGSQGLVMGSLWTPTLQWETVKKTNIGIDAGVLKNRIVLSADYFSNTTENMLNVVEADPLSGFSYYINNDGAFKSTGFELDLFVRAVDMQKLKWDIHLNYSKYKTEITELPIDNKITEIYNANILSRIGQPLGVFYGYKTNGVYSTTTEAENDGLYAVLPNTSLIPLQAGDVRFVDNNPDQIIDEKDMEIIGDPNPDFTGMIANKVSWNGISLEAVVSICYGNDVFNHLRYQLESMSNTHNQTQAVLNRWKTEGQITDVPKAYANDPVGNSRFSDRWIEDGSYIRLKSITLSYNIPWKPMFIRGMEVYVSGKNLWTSTKYLGFDPEFSTSEFSLAQGIDIGLTPQYKTVLAGIKLNF